MTDRDPTATARKPTSPAPHTRATPAADTAAEPAAPAAPTCDAAPGLDSAALLRGNNSVAIIHRGAVYRLQATRQGKLILTK